MALGDRFKNAWNAFVGRDPTLQFNWDVGPSYGIRPDRFRYTRGNEKTIVTSVYTRLAIDTAALTVRHCKTNKEGGYLEDMDSGLNYCLNVEANIDQTGRSLLQDTAMSMFDEGVVAVVPVDTDKDPDRTKGYEILTLRTGKIVDWYPRHVRVKLYNDRTGKHEELLLPKTDVAIIENPFYSVMNEPNSTAQRLIRKLNQLDAVDSRSTSDKLDLIIQLPYIVKTAARKAQAEARKADLENQLATSKFGIAYTDGTEKVTQLNRPIENKVLESVDYLQKQLYAQLGLTEEIMNGTADEKVMENYYARTIEPIISAIVNEMKRKFLTKTARSQHQTVQYYRDPFQLTPVSSIAEMSDKFTRNEIMSSNEIRQRIGLKPVQSEQANELRNKNLSPAVGQKYSTTNGETIIEVNDEGKNVGAIGNNKSNNIQNFIQKHSNDMV